MTPIFLGLDEVLEIHRDQIERYGGGEGVRDMGLLESALAMPRAGTRDEYFHADLFEMAAVYLFHIAKNHAFVDGNKRVGAAAALVFLEMNGVAVRVTNRALVETVLAVVEGKIQKHVVAEFLRKHARS
ncbi:MAG: type II toxin-antitoxin system death-on-curing family toxin [Planctomycetaceae bacterium]